MTHRPKTTAQKMLTVDWEATVRSEVTPGRSMPMVLYRVAFRKKAMKHTGTAAEYRSKPLWTWGAWPRPAGIRKPMNTPTIRVTIRPGRLKPTTSALG